VKIKAFGCWFEAVDGDLIINNFELKGKAAFLACSPQSLNYHDLIDFKL
jgi:hypothetical protein